MHAKITANKHKPGIELVEQKGSLLLFGGFELYAQVPKCIGPFSLQSEQRTACSQVSCEQELCCQYAKEIQAFWKKDKSREEITNFGLSSCKHTLILKIIIKRKLGSMFQVPKVPSHFSLKKNSLPNHPTQKSYKTYLKSQYNLPYFKCTNQSG